ncbi:cobaltochelatase subunit CobN [Limibaculum sp. M0105]|uniref:Cobaltochelatase subunit CobN n=1 Tax=Thermohalobaculum xanthum TaxID=2753746 RepID=A0A8J7SC28_9RHOB|nr:cobaltochelatase subunit CobN [Thermohalobaculum xanthum]MBK0397662.1 cobaltochelatase subunit CobN [Thermohalobaculum xanthum]
MHLLLAQPGQADESAAVDLGQSPAELIVITAADTELAALSEARAGLADHAPELRLASLLHLAHPLSVDLYLDQTATRAKLVIARVLGGESYWSYGLEQFAARLGEAGIPFAALPGDDKADLGLSRVSTVGAEDYAALWAYLVEGGPENSANFLRYARWMIARDSDAGTADADPPPPARPLLRAGVYWPGAGISDLDTVSAAWRDHSAPVVPVAFYRSLVAGAGLHPINRLVRALMTEGLNPLPVFVASLKDPVSQGTIESLFAEAPPSVVLNATSFAVSSPQSGDWQATVLDRPGVPVLQVVLAGGSEDAWEKGKAGLSARDIAMNVALPEVDGRILARAVSFKGEAFFDESTQCRISAYRARGDRISFTARLAAAWAKLGRKPRAERRVGIVLANYPNRDGRLANGVGLDTPESCVGVLRELESNGYTLGNVPPTAVDLMSRILAGPTNWLADRVSRSGGERLGLDAYRRCFSDLPWAIKEAVTSRWGEPEADPFVDGGDFVLPVLSFGNVVVGVQPARGYNIDPVESYHAPDLVPPHNYIAFYAWLRETFGADALVHLGKHGNLEWLPGKAVALSEECFPEAVLGPMPHLYPFIVNDPGEGTQAKRRAQAVIVDHLTPPLTRAETYGPLRQLEALVDEYYEASGVDPRRLDHLRREIRSLVSAARLDLDAGITPEMPEDEALQKLDTYLCELKEAQIRDGLHVFGRAPEGRLERDLAIALVRVPRGDGKGGNASLIRALARDCGIDPEAFDPLDCDMGQPWDGPRHKFLWSAGGVTEPWRTNGDTVERLEKLAELALQWRETPKHFHHTAPVLEALHAEILPAIRACGASEMRALLDGLDGRFVPPGPSGAPTRGRPDVLPTGRNFFSVDSRAVPTPAAYTLGWHSASLLVERHLQEHGDWLRTIVLTAWGTANMRTGGDDIAQGLALMGVRPTWDQASRRVTGFEIVPLEHLARPRVDVTLRVSGFFRDAFPAQIALFDAAARAVMALDEPDDQNPLAARFRTERARLAQAGMEDDQAAREAGYRVFGSKPGAYGAGLQAMIDERLWERRGDLADSYINWGGYAYAADTEGVRARDAFERRLGASQAVVQNQDNREHDLLDSDDYYQFEGGAAAAIEHLSGRAPEIYHNDHSRPERPVVRTLEDEIGRVVRARVVNPKWIEGVRRHGYKGAFEIAATIDYLFAFAATTHAVKSHHFDLVHEAVIEDESVREFIAEANAAALREIASRLSEAVDRGLWQPRSNSARALLSQLQETT